jgi:hypothetical protein
MAFDNIMIDTVKLVILTNRTSDDGTLTPRTCFIDGDVNTNCEEMTAGTEGLRIQLNVPKTAFTAMTVKFWDAGYMDAGDMSVMPYTDINSVDDTHDVSETLISGEDIDFPLTQDFFDDMGDADGAGNVAIRCVSADGSSPKPKGAEIEIEMTWNTAPLTGFTYDNDGAALGDQVVQAYKVVSTGPLVLADEPFATDTSHSSTGAYSLDLYAEDWILIAFDAGSPDKMDISEIITHSV